MSKNRINWGPTGKEIYDRTYSREKPDGTKETWEETVERVVDGNLALVPKKFQLKNERSLLVEHIKNFKIIPAGRHLWAAGVPGRQFLFNCHVAHWNDEPYDHYAFTFDELMKGGGVGCNYSNRYIKKLPPVKNKVTLDVVCNPGHKDHNRVKHLLSSNYSHEWPGSITIEDSREGWIFALNKVLRAAFDGSANPKVVLDISIIRPYGSPIKGFGGTASGPTPLVEMLFAIVNLLNDNVGNRLGSIQHMLIDHYIASCVVAGNVRRSARMSIKSWKDDDILEFIKCKSDASRVAHFTTNISVEVDNSFFKALAAKEPTAVKVYGACIDGLYESGEPGFWNYSLSQTGESGEVVCTNPCGEIVLEPWENCNLGHVNLDSFYADEIGAKLAFKLMTRFLIRATFGDIGSTLQKEVVVRNRRIGVGFFGYQGWTCKQGIKYSESHRSQTVISQLREFYAAVKREAQDFSHLLRIPVPVKLTTLAPTGTIAKLPGKSEGAQAIYAKYFIRRMRIADINVDKIQFYKDFGYHLEPDVYTKDTTVVSFWCKDTLVEEMEALSLDTTLVEDQSEISIEDCLAVQAMLQREYADNAISYTINIEKDTPKKKIYHNVIRYLPEIKGTTIILGVGDRPQPPYTRITKEEFESYKGPVMVSQGELECKGNVCPIK
jgi:ribonucleoside-triphosphate reductase